MASEIKIGDLVWAKLGRYRAWPARVVKPNKTAQKKQKKSSDLQHWVCFFGTNDHSWIGRTNIFPYEEFKEEFQKDPGSTKFRKALLEIEEFQKKVKDDPTYLESQNEENEEQEEEPEDKFDKLLNSSLSSKKSNKTPEVKRKRSLSNSNSKKRKMSSSPSHIEENGISSCVRNEILNVPQPLDIPEAPIVDFSSMSELVKTKEISPSTFRIGFLGVGIMSSGIIKNLINFGHKVNLWSRKPEKCQYIQQQAEKIHPGLVNVLGAPFEVMQCSDIIFSCVGDPRSAKENVVGNCGVAMQGAASDSLEGKGYVEMTGIDQETSRDICKIIMSKGGRYLEAQMQGSKQEADEGSLVILAAGNHSLFNDCQSCFDAMGKTAFFLGEVGNATAVNLILQVMKAISLLGLAEGLALADRCGISHEDFRKIFKSTSIVSPYLSHKAEKIEKNDFTNVEHAIKHMQKDLKLALNLSDSLKQPLLMASTANEIYKHARRTGYDDHDASSVYVRTRY